jgi:hypothetical protein
MYMFETVGIPLLILCTGSIVLGNVEKKSVTPAPRLASKPIFVLSALAVLSSYFGAFPSDEKNDGPETSLAAQSNKPTSDSQTYQPVHDKTYYAKGMQMTRKQLIAQFGPPEIASDGALAYRAVRPENGKDTLCFFHFDRYAGDSEDKAYRLSC